MSYQTRALDAQLDLLLPTVPAIALEGPKAVGKTETARQRAHQILRLDTPEGRDILSADYRFAGTPPGIILIDEWQKLPESWDYVRRAVDDKSPHNFLLTGSATPAANAPLHSGAGRIISLRMRPMALFERGKTEPTVSLRELFAGAATIAGSTGWTLADYVHAIASSGFPGIHEMDEVVRNIQLDSYLARIVDRDLPEQGYTTRNREDLLAWMRAYGAASSTTTSYSEILAAATPGQSDKPTKKTTLKYREKLSEIWLLDEVPAWSFTRSPFVGLAKAPKHQLADPALVLRLLGVPARGLTTPSHAHLLGPLFESLATLSVRVAAEANFGHVSHFRTQRGDHEVDLIARDQNGYIIPIEVKLTAQVKDDDVKHLVWLKDKLPDDVVDMVILTTGERAYRRPDGVAVVPLALLGA